MVYIFLGSPEHTVCRVHYVCLQLPPFICRPDNVPRGTDVGTVHAFLGLATQISYVSQS